MIEFFSNIKGAIKNKYPKRNNGYFSLNHSNEIMLDNELLSLILEYADICEDAGRGIEYLSVSKSALKNQKMRDIFRKYINVVCGITIKWSANNASVLGVIHSYGGNISIH